MLTKKTEWRCHRMRDLLPMQTAATKTLKFVDAFISVNMNVGNYYGKVGAD